MNFNDFFCNRQAHPGPPRLSRHPGIYLTEGLKDIFLVRGLNPDSCIFDEYLEHIP